MKTSYHYTDTMNNKWRITSVMESDVQGFIICDVAPLGELAAPSRVTARRLRISVGSVVCVVSEPPSVEHVPVAIAAH